MNISNNYVSDIIDEIALEGLDGITLEALWKRLSVRANFCFKIDEKSKEFIWTVCTRLNDLKFYELPEKRPPLQFYDYVALHKDHQEANIELDKLYPYHGIKHEYGIYGSCQHYSTRKDITRVVVHMDLQTAESLSDKLVIVASQECRYLALLGNHCPPNLDFSKSRAQYDILERIGRSRSLGVSTHGKGSLQSIVDDSKSIFHYLKFLIKYKIVKKQSLFGTLYSNPNGSKIYLMRYYGEYLNEYQLILQTAIEELKTRPNFTMSYGDFYQLFDPDKRARVKKYSKTAMFRKYIMVSKLLPYREFFPNAPQSEWERKNQGGEKTIRCFQLLDPNTEVSDVFDKDCESDDENGPSGFLTTESYYFGLPLIQQFYVHVKNSGPHGITIRELSEITGLSRSFVRSLLKRLILDKHCKCFEEINGRRHTKRYIVGENARNLAAASEIVQMLSEGKPNGSPEKSNSDNDVKYGFDENKMNESIEEKKVDIYSLEEKNVPYRTLRRIGMIIKTIKTHRYRLFFQIYRYVLDEEVKEGLRATVCRMTVNRILQKLEKDGLIKIVDLTHKTDKTVVKLYMEPTFVLDEKLTETILHTHTNYKNIDLSKESDAENIELEKHLGVVLLENLTEMKQMLSNVKMRRVPRPALKENKERELTCSPKFVRLNIIHDLMFYLMYEYTGITDRTQEELIKQLSKVCEIDEELRQEMPTIYGTQPSSYMFVPPLKNRDGLATGWFLMSDLLLRLPLSIFVKILRVSDTTPELLNYLNHPIRKHFLVKDLPKGIRKILFHSLKCIASFSNDIRRLCLLGLLQLGGKCGKQQYQTLFYLNRNATLYDTTSSPPAYVHVPSELEFPVKRYKFENKTDVKRYWQDMCQICLGTNLGVKTSMIGKEVSSVRELSRETLGKLPEQKNPLQAAAEDDGTLPGDHLGAGGIDSVMFSFLRSNWIGPVTKTTDNTPRKILKKVPLQKLKKDLAKKKQRIHLQKSRLKKLLRKPEVVAPKPILFDSVPKSNTKVRKVKERKLRFKREKKTYYDEVDMEALKLKNSLRVTWSPAEDHLLLICQVAMSYLCPASRGFVRIPWSEVRCKLQKSLVESRNKTQKAIARRILYMMKNQTTRRSVNLCLEELNQIPEVAERFNCSELMKLIKPSAPNLTELQNELYEKFHELIDYIRERFSKGSSFSSDGMEKNLLPDSWEDLNEIYIIDEVVNKEPLSLQNIRESVIRAILMSSLSCKSDKTSSAIQLFEIYRQYEDDELHRAIKGLNADKVIVVRKFNSANFKNGRCLPLSNAPCKLSFSFQNLLNMRYSQNLYSDAYNVITKVLESTDGCNVDLTDCNVPLYILASNDLITLRTTVPNQIVALGSGNSSDADAYAKMLKRYCEILHLSDSDSKLVCTPGHLLTTVDDDAPASDEANNKRPASGADDTEPGVKKARLESEDSSDKCAGEKEKDVAKKSGSGSWRVALYMMREEAKKEIDNVTGNRSQEFFVVNASTVHCSKTDALESYTNAVDSKVVSTLIRSVISRFSVPLSLVNEESVYDEFQKNNGTKKLDLVKQVLEFIYQKREFGATNKDLTSKFNKEDLTEIMYHLIGSKIIIKTGIEETRYVAQKYATPWLLNSFRITRLEREKIKPTEVSVLELPDSVVQGPEDSSVPRKRKKGIITSEDLKSEDHNPPSCSMDDSNKVKIIIRPWMRIDGSLNRKVLDRFLGTILGYIMVHPGITIKRVMDKFTPSLLPIWSKDLIEILDQIGCLTLTTYVVKKKATLFCKEEIDYTDGFNGIDDDDYVAVEAKVDALIKLGLFIGKKSYSKDFLVD